MKCRAYVAARSVVRIVEPLALRSFTLRNLSLTGEPLRLFDCCSIADNFRSTLGMREAPGG